MSLRTRRLLTRGLVAAAAAAAASEALWAWRAVGGRLSDTRREQLAGSPQWNDGEFRNENPSASGDVSGGFLDVARRMLDSRGTRHPQHPIPLQSTAMDSSGDDFAVTWFGHASALIELDGGRFLCDPVWSQRCSPSRVVGPKRLHPAPVDLSELGRIDAVVISHDHYDHLDYPTVSYLASHTQARFIVPLGVGQHLQSWGIDSERIVELDWGLSTTVAGVQLSCVQAQHFSGRTLRRDQTLWASWVIASPRGRVFFSGDTGYFEGYAELGRQYGPFDVALMAIGAYDPAWASIHLNPEEAISAAQQLQAALVIPIHWATFVLAPHPWAEPIERAWTAAQRARVDLVTPEVGQRVVVGEDVTPSMWWRDAAATAGDAMASSSAGD